MKKIQNVNWKQVGAVAFGALVVGATAGAVVFPHEVVQTQIVYKDVITEVPVEVIKEVTVEVPVEVEVEKLVEVDNGDMAFVLQRLEDKMVIDDAAEIVSELKAEDKALEVCLASLERDELFDMLEDKGIVADEDEVKIIKIYSDYEDVEVVESDFDDGAYEFIVKLKIEDTEDDVKKSVFASLRLEDGDFELLDVSE